VPPLGERRKVPMMYRALPVGANLEAMQKEARKLLRALQRNDVAATQRYRPFDFLDSTFPARLADAQYIIARRYGFRSWANLKDRLIVRRTKTNPGLPSPLPRHRSI